MSLEPDSRYRLVDPLHRAFVPAGAEVVEAPGQAMMYRQYRARQQEQLLHWLPRYERHAVGQCACPKHTQPTVQLRDSRPYHYKPFSGRGCECLMCIPDQPPIPSPPAPLFHPNALVVVKFNW